MIETDPLIFPPSPGNTCLSPPFLLPKSTLNFSLSSYADPGLTGGVGLLRTLHSTLPESQVLQEFRSNGSIFGKIKQ